MPKQTPSIGRVVHYVATNGDHVPADICEVLQDGATNLFVKDSTIGRASFAYGVEEEPSGAVPGTWHWPEYVPPTE